MIFVKDELDMRKTSYKPDVIQKMQELHDLLRKSSMTAPGSKRGSIANLDELELSAIPEKEDQPTMDLRTENELLKKSTMS